MTHRLRLRVKLAKALNSTETTAHVNVCGRDVTIQSENKVDPLSESKWIILWAGGFGSEDDARAFGERLKLTVEVASLAARLGVDAGNDEITNWVNAEWAVAIGLVDPGDRVLPNIHGITVMPDDDLNRVPTGSPELTVRSDPSHFFGALAEIPADAPLGKRSANGVKLLNLALMTNEALAQLVLAFSAVEELGQDERWNDDQLRLIDETADDVAARATSAEGKEVADAIRRMHRLGLRQGVMRVLSRLGLSPLKKDWDRLYGLRSGVFHGTARLPSTELSGLATEVVTLCGKIILAQLRQEGVEPPRISAIHYPT